MRFNFRTHRHTHNHKEKYYFNRTRETKQQRGKRRKKNKRKNVEMKILMKMNNVIFQYKHYYDTILVVVISASIYIFIHQYINFVTRDFSATPF